MGCPPPNPHPLTPTPLPQLLREAGDLARDPEGTGGKKHHFQQLGCRGCGTGLCTSPAQSLCCGASAFLSVICRGLTGLTRGACPQLRVREHAARGDVACPQSHSSKRGSDTNLGPIPREGLCLRQFFFFFFFHFLASTRDRTHDPCSASAESEPLGSQGSPHQILTVDMTVLTHPLSGSLQMEPD